MPSSHLFTDPSVLAPFSEIGGVILTDRYPRSWTQEEENISILFIICSFLLVYLQNLKEMPNMSSASGSSFDRGFGVQRLLMLTSHNLY